MHPLLRGFASELTKLAEHDYLTSMLMAAAAAPVISIAGRGVARALHNRAGIRALEGAKDAASVRRIQEEIHQGPLVGHSRPDLPLNKRPMVTPADLASDAAKAVLSGTLVHAARTGARSRKREKDA